MARRGRATLGGAPSALPDDIVTSRSRSGVRLPRRRSFSSLARPILSRGIGLVSAFFASTAAAADGEYSSQIGRDAVAEAGIGRGRVVYYAHGLGVLPDWFDQMEFEAAVSTSLTAEAVSAQTLLGEDRALDLIDSTRRAEIHGALTTLGFEKLLYFELLPSGDRLDVFAYLYELPSTKSPPRKERFEYSGPGRPGREARREAAPDSLKSVEVRENDDANPRPNNLAAAEPLPEPPRDPVPESAPAQHASTGGASLDRSLIDAVIKRNMNQILQCYRTELNYRRELKQKPDLAGKVTVRFVIANDGTVSSATTKASTLGSLAVESCLNERMKHYLFPSPSGRGSVIVTYPFVFTPG